MEAIHGDHLNISAWLGFAEAAKRSGLIPRITDLVEKIESLNNEMKELIKLVDKSYIVQKMACQSLMS